MSSCDFVFYVALIVTIIWVTIVVKKFWKGRYYERREIIDNSKVIIITGCDSGIGLELAKQSLDWGFHPVACCLRLESDGATHLKNRNVDVLRLDVSSEDSVRQLHTKAKELQSQNKEIYCLVNNAGVMTYAMTEWHTWHQIESQLMINLSGMIQVTRVLLPFLRRSKGRVVNVSSPQGLVATPLMSTYCASKAGVEAFSQALRRETARHGVKVTVVRPGDLSTQTGILHGNLRHLESMWENLNEESKMDYANEYEAMKRMFQRNFTKTDVTPLHLRDRYLIEAFRLAITTETPEFSYIAGPIVLRIFLNLIQILPVPWTDFLIKHNVPNKMLKRNRS